jgi:hypothetical protein
MKSFITLLIALIFLSGIVGMLVYISIPFKGKHVPNIVPCKEPNTGLGIEGSIENNSVKSISIVYDGIEKCVYYIKLDSVVIK